VQEIAAMNEAALREKLFELAQTVQALPAIGQPKAASADGVYLSNLQPKVTDVEDALDYLRLQLKYLVFDLEATRRENRYLRKMLESRPPRPPSDFDDNADR